MSARLWALVLLAALALSLAGCANDPVVELPDWTLATDAIAAKPVRLPAHLDADLPRRESTYHLRTHVTLPQWMQGRTLTFVLPQLEGQSSLFVDGEEMSPLDETMRWGYRGTDQSSFRIPPRLAERGDLDLDLAVAYRELLISRVDVVPRISATEEGDSRFLFVRNFNRWTSTVAAAVIVVNALAYGLVFLRDRRRVAYGWFALESVGVVDALFHQGVLQFFAGPHEAMVLPTFICLGEFASVQFTHAQFKLGPPSRAWLVATVSVFALAFALPSPFLAPFWVALFSVTMTFVNVVYQSVTMLRVWRRDGPSAQVVAILVSWILLAVIGTPDIIAWYGLGEVAGGLRGVPLGTAVIALMQAYVLSREHHTALVRADDLNDQLTERVGLLETKNREVEHLNDELRHQIGARADTLAAALARASTVSGPTHTLMAGERLAGRYDIVRRVGEGAAGIVYEVRRASDGTRLALKLLRGAADATDMARFAREAQLISKLDHPNVLRIVDVDVSATGFFYLVVEFVEGLSLVQHKGRFGDASFAIPVLRQMAEGLAAIHAQGIVHRDLKPANVLVTHEASTGLVNVKIADFGIASALRADRAAALVPDAPTVTGSGDTEPAELLLTTTGAWMGTPRYMAPELAGGAQAADRATDVFSLGLIAYELFAKKIPYEGSAALQRLKGDSYSPPPPLAATCPRLAPEIAEIIDACLAEQPAARPEASAIARALAKFDRTGGAR